MFKINDYTDADGYDPTDLAWGMFKNTGNPAYYLLYHDLIEEDEEDERRR